MNFCASTPGCYLTFVMSTLFDLSNRRSSKKIVFTCWSVLTDFCHYLHLLLVGSFLGSLWGIELFEGSATVACVLMEVLLVLKLNPKTYYLECTNVANKDCVKFCMKEKFQVYGRMSNEMKDGLKLKLGDATRVTPRNI